MNNVQKSFNFLYKILDEKFKNGVLKMPLNIASNYYNNKIIINRDLRLIEEKKYDFKNKTHAILKIYDEWKDVINIMVKRGSYIDFKTAREITLSMEIIEKYTKNTLKINI
jgi:hypothetical protein